MFELRRPGQLILAVVLAWSTLGADALFSQQPPTARNRRTVMLDGREVVEGEVIVRYRSQAGQIERERAEIQAYSDGAETIGRLGTRRMRSRQLTTRQMLAALRANPDVEFAEPNYIIRALRVPDDSFIDSLWALINTGQVVDGQAGVAGADIGAAAAWEKTTGSKTNVIAILDSGIDFGHPDLQDNLFQAPRQFAVTIGSMTVTCAAGTSGYNALANTCAPVDDSGHGSHVAGIIGAIGNNGLGVTGVNWTASLMPLKVLGPDGTGTTADAVEAINWAIKTKAALGVDANIRVLNASWGGGLNSQALNDEIAAANNADILFVAAAGSDGTNNDVTPHYPASYTSSNIISVTATDNRGELADFANYGANSVDLGAPGGTILSTSIDGSYAQLGGTSMSAAFVSGAAGLVLSYCPSNTATLKSRILAGVDSVASLGGKTVSGGRLNVARVLDSCHIPLTATINGSTITVTLNNGPGNTRDWLGLYCPATNADNAFTTWKYLNGQQTAPTTGLTAATVSFPAPSQSGMTCNVRLFSDNSMTNLAISNTVTTGGAAAPTLSIGDVSISEGNSGTSVATFTATLSPVNTSQTVTVNYATANGSATAGSDYVATSGTLTFSPSAATRTISVTINGDTTTEANETFFVNLSGATNATIGDGQATGTITNDDAAAGPAITLSSTTVAPGGVIDFTVSGGPANQRDWVTLGLVTAADNGYVDWKYLNGTRTVPATGVSTATLQFTAPSTPGTYNIRFFADNGYTKLATSAPISVTTTPAGPSLSIGDVNTVEGHSGTVTSTFTVTLSPANSSQTVTVNYATANGSATAGSDYVAASGTLTFAPSVTTQTVSVVINGDTTAETNETFFVNLSGASNATIGDGQAIGTITNDDAPAGPAITLASTTVAPGATIDFTVSGGPANQRDWVTFGLASAPDNGYIDWKYLNGTRTVPATGVSSASLQFTAPATTGSYNIRFFADNGYTKLATSATITVTSAPATPTLSVGDRSVAEGNSGTSVATFTVTLSPVNSSQTVTVNYATANGSATAGSDYVAANGTLTFNPGVGTQTVAVTINGDTTIEPNETFLLNLSGATNASIGDGQAVGTITNDDSQSTSGGPAISAPASVPPGGTIDVVVSGSTGHTNDWVGLFPRTAGDGGYINWVYLSGTRTPPSSGLTNASFSIPAPAAEGIYDVRLFAYNGGAKLATSGAINVVAGSALRINDVNITEGNSGATVATFTVTLSPAHSESVTVNYATADNGATSPSDYVAANGTLTFAPGETSKNVMVTVNGDTSTEGSEQFVVNLSAAVNASIIDGQGVGTIVNDDGPPVPTVSVPASVPAGGTITVTVQNGPANPQDWVALFLASADDRSYIRWMYLNGNQSPPNPGMSSATLNFPAPATPGTYQIRWFANNGYTRIAVSSLITVQ